MRRDALAARSVMAALLLLVAACATAATPSTSTSEVTLADREAIEATLYRYVRGLDRRDPDLYASAWAEESEFQVGDTLYKGREGMRSIITGLNDGSVAGPSMQTFHMDANSRLEFRSADHALHHAYYLTIGRTGEGAETTNAIIATGGTIDELRKIDGDWLIVRRTIQDEP